MKLELIVKPTMMIIELLALFNLVYFSEGTYYDLGMCGYARALDTCTEYVFDTTSMTYPIAVSTCQTLHGGKILNLTTVDEWDFVRTSYDNFGFDSSMFIGVKLPAGGNRRLNLIYEDGRPFNYSKYSISFYEDYANISTTPIATQLVYHHDGGGTIHGEDPSWTQGVICVRAYNGSNARNTSTILEMPLNTNVTHTALGYIDRLYYISMTECAIICKLMNNFGDGCFGIDYNTETSECNVKQNIFYNSYLDIPDLTFQYLSPNTECN